MSGFSDDEERQLRIDVMRADIDLKRRQSFWETPKAIAAIVAVTAVVFGTVAGLAGFKLGSQPPQTINIHLDNPLPVAPRNP